MNSPLNDPWEVLGLPRGAGREEVKAAFRENAKKCHPDRDPSPEAAARFVRIQSAADALLNGTSDKVVRPGPASPMSPWELRLDNLVRQRRFPFYFSAVCLAGGCALFAGAVIQHLQYPMYNGRLYIPAQHQARKELNEQQQLMNDMLSQKLSEAKLPQKQQ